MGGSSGGGEELRATRSQEILLLLPAEKLSNHTAVGSWFLVPPAHIASLVPDWFLVEPVVQQPVVGDNVEHLLSESLQRQSSSVVINPPLWTPLSPHPSVPHPSVPPSLRPLSPIPLSPIPPSLHSSVPLSLHHLTHLLDFAGAPAGTINP